MEQLPVDRIITKDEILRLNNIEVLQSYFSAIFREIYSQDDHKCLLEFINIVGTILDTLSNNTVVYETLISDKIRGRLIVGYVSGNDICT